MPAIAICKNCSRGLCTLCAVEVGNGIACREKCENDVKMLNTMIDRGKTSHERARSSHSITAIFLAALGLVFLGFGISSFRASTLFAYMIGTAFVMLCAALLFYRLGRRYN